MTTVMKKLCVKCEGLYSENTVECPWCQHDELVPMTEEQYNKFYINIDVKKYRRELPLAVRENLEFLPSDFKHTIMTCDNCKEEYQPYWANHDMSHCSEACEKELEAKYKETEIVFVEDTNQKFKHCDCCFRAYNVGLSFADEDERFCSVNCEEEFWQEPEEEEGEE